MHSFKYFNHIRGFRVILAILEILGYVNHFGTLVYFLVIFEVLIYFRSFECFRGLYDHFGCYESISFLFK